MNRYASVLDHHLHVVYQFRQLEDALRHAEQQAQELSAKVQEREDRISGLMQERQFAEDNARRLEENLHRRNEEVAQYAARVHQLELELEQLRDEISTLKREHSRYINDQTRALQESTGQQSHTKAQLDDLIKAKAEVDIELKSSRDQLQSLTDETDKLRRQVHVLRQESADKELKIGLLSKQFNEAREDAYNLNIALDAKQQELEMIKRKAGVRGTAGSTPLSAQASTSKPTHHRRESSIFSATPRPSSAMSNATDIGSVSDAPSATLRKERKNSWESSSAAKIPALGKSIRTNANASASATSTPSTVGKTLSRAGSESSIMGPPTSKPRVSMGTPTPTSRLPSSITRSSSIKATAVPTHRRASSVANDQTPKSRLAKNAIGSPTPDTVMEQEESEKENVDISSSSTPRRAPIPSLT
ncbi:hypothetical protein CVT24_003313 [Panaeolus cyanescens]|uniref:NUDE domain-containing protein n=1 Tax=Panaeolus cyanescens TaxID=181874 RepID=A0A409Y6M3_9AGAR|nr:hypothetical protein CVT24_003313 [Panaeolus cyanescens]